MGKLVEQITALATAAHCRESMERSVSGLHEVLTVSATCIFTTDHYSAYAIRPDAREHSPAASGGRW